MITYPRRAGLDWTKPPIPSGSRRTSPRSILEPTSNDNLLRALRHAPLQYVLPSPLRPNHPSRRPPRHHRSLRRTRPLQTPPSDSLPGYPSPQPPDLDFFADGEQGGVAPRQQFTQRDPTLRVSRSAIDPQQLSSGSMTGIILGYLTAKIGRLFFFTFSGFFLLAAV